MNRSVVFHLKGNGIANVVNRNSSFLFLTGTYLSGVLLGCLLAPEFSDKLYELHLSTRCSGNLLNVLFVTFWSYLPFQLGCFLFGTSVVGAVFIPITSLLKGYFAASVCVHLYSEFLLKGVVFSALAYVPLCALCSVSLLICADYALKYSVNLFKSVLGQNTLSINYLEFKKYCLNNLVLLIVLFFVALFDVVGTRFFVKLFGFTI